MVYSNTFLHLKGFTRAQIEKGREEDEAHGRIPAEFRWCQHSWWQ